MRSVMMLAVAGVVFCGCAGKPQRKASPEEAAMVGEARRVLGEPIQPPDPGAPPADAEPITRLLDQNDKPFAQRPGTRYTVGLLVNSGWRAESEKWSRSTLELLPPTCQVVHILDLQDKSRRMAGFIGAGVRASVGKDDVHVMMDWDGLMTKSAGIPATGPAVFALDEHQRLIKVITGPWSEEAARGLAEIYKGRP